MTHSFARRNPSPALYFSGSREAGVTLEAGVSVLHQEDVGMWCPKAPQPHKKLDTVSNKRLHSLLRNVMSQAKSVKILNFECASMLKWEE